MESRDTIDVLLKDLKPAERKQLVGLLRRSGYWVDQSRTCALIMLKQAVKEEDCPMCNSVIGFVDSSNAGLNFTDDAFLQNHQDIIREMMMDYGDGLLSESQRQYL